MVARSLLIYRLFGSVLDGTEMDMVQWMIGIEDGKLKTIRQLAKIMGQTQEQTALKWKTIQRKIALSQPNI
jgi:hypothetical protein